MSRKNLSGKNLSLRHPIRHQHAEAQNVAVVTLGCPRNVVDSQDICGRLKRQGARVVTMEKADAVIVNTCAFIADAKKESVDTILDLIEMKKKGKIRRILVAGCLAQRYGSELLKEMKEIDAIIGIPSFGKVTSGEPFLLTASHFAYVKICESCYNHCAFCVIPKIKGRFTSRREESIIAEVHALEERGVREINLIGQDITAYGRDLYGEWRLAKLLALLARKVKKIQRIRLSYLFPVHITEELLDTIAGEFKICRYIDAPLQHISDHLLKEMKRGMNSRQTRTLFQKIRKRLPEAAIRTGFIVGLPGETEKDYKELLKFMTDFRFDKVGALAYSREEGTLAYDFPGQVPEGVKARRLDRLMKTQQEISRECLARFVGQTLKVMIDEKDKKDPGLFIGRTEFDAPEVDGVVTVHARKMLQPGDLVNVRITDSLEYDLVGETV